VPAIGLVDIAADPNFANVGQRNLPADQHFESHNITLFVTYFSKAQIQVTVNSNALKPQCNFQKYNFTSLVFCFCLAANCKWTRGNFYTTFLYFCGVHPPATPAKNHGSPSDLTPTSRAKASSFA